VIAQRLGSRGEGFSFLADEHSREMMNMDWVDESSDGEDEDVWNADERIDVSRL